MYAPLANYANAARCAQRPRPRLDLLPSGEKSSALLHVPFPAGARPRARPRRGSHYSDTYWSFTNSNCRRRQSRRVRLGSSRPPPAPAWPASARPHSAHRHPSGPISAALACHLAFAREQHNPPEYKSPRLAPWTLDPSDHPSGAASPASPREKSPINVKISLMERRRGGSFVAPCVSPEAGARGALPD